MIIELKNPLTENYKELKRFVISDKISWHFNATTTINNSNLNILLSPKLMSAHISRVKLI